MSSFFTNVQRNTPMLCIMYCEIQGFVLLISTTCDHILRITFLCHHERTREERKQVCGLRKMGQEPIFKGSTSMEDEIRKPDVIYSPLLLSV